MMYQKLLSNPMLRYKKELAKVIQKGLVKDLLNKKKGKYLQPNTCRIPIIYTIPKIHKDKSKPTGETQLMGLTQWVQGLESTLIGFYSRS